MSVESLDVMKEKFKDKISEIKNRLDFVLDNVGIQNDIENFTNIYEDLLIIDDKLEKIESNMNNSVLDNIMDLNEKNRIIDLKIMKLFTPYLLYYKMCLMQNNI